MGRCRSSILGHLWEGEEDSSVGIGEECAGVAILTVKVSYDSASDGRGMDTILGSLQPVAPTGSIGRRMELVLRVVRAGRLSRAVALLMAIALLACDGANDANELSELGSPYVIGPRVLAQYDDPLARLRAWAELERDRRNVSEPTLRLLEGTDSARVESEIARSRKRIMQSGSTIWHEYYGYYFRGRPVPSTSRDAERIRERITTPEQVLAIEWLTDEDVAKVMDALDGIGW